MSHTLSRSEILQCQQEGYRAYLEGKQPTACPYKLGTPEVEATGDAWFRGYAASKTDRAKTNRAAELGMKQPSQWLSQPVNGGRNAEPT